jgi:hypothetical protein
MLVARAEQHKRRVRKHRLKRLACEDSQVNQVGSESKENQDFARPREKCGSPWTIIFPDSFLLRAGLWYSISAN